MKAAFLLVIFFSIFICNCESKMSIEESAVQLKSQYGGDSGIYDVWYGNRFGSNVLVIQCISDGDKGRLKGVLPSTFNGFIIHFTSPIWGIGNLLPDLGEEIKIIVASGDAHFKSGTKENEHLLKLYEEIRTKEQQYWDSLDGGKKRRILSSLILEKRKKSPSFANCGDKFLKAE